MCNAKPEIGENKGSNSTSMNFTWRATKTSEGGRRGKVEERRIRENSRGCFNGSKATISYL